VGASAGLNLLFDHYRYRLNGRDITDAASPVIVSCEMRSAVPDLEAPIDLAMPEARAWLEAFIWPEQIEERDTLRAAIALALATGVHVVRGDATTDMSRIIADLPGTEPVVLFTASLLSYLNSDARTAFAAQIDAIAGNRPVAWAFAEAPGLLATCRMDMPTLAGPLARNNSQYLVGVSMPSRDGQNDRLLALADPYLRWFAPARSATDDFDWVSRD
jgi:hypothetical protein